MGDHTIAQAMLGLKAETISKMRLEFSERRWDNLMEEISNWKAFPPMGTEAARLEVRAKIKDLAERGELVLRLNRKPKKKAESYKKWEAGRKKRQEAMEQKWATKVEKAELLQTVGSPRNSKGSKVSNLCQSVERCGIILSRSGLLKLAKTWGTSRRET
jgi:hypothetical protein